MQQVQVQFSDHPPLISAIKSQECLQQTAIEIRYLPTTQSSLSALATQTQHLPRVTHPHSSLLSKEREYKRIL